MEKTLKESTKWLDHQKSYKNLQVDDPKNVHTKTTKKGQRKYKTTTVITHINIAFVRFKVSVSGEVLDDA